MNFGAAAMGADSVLGALQQAQQKKQQDSLIQQLPPELRMQLIARQIAGNGAQQTNMPMNSTNPQPSLASSFTQGWDQTQQMKQNAALLRALQNWPNQTTVAQNAPDPSKPNSPINMQGSAD